MLSLLLRNRTSTNNTIFGNVMTMKKSADNQKKITACLLIFYLVVLTWIVLFKMQFSYQDLRQFTGFRRINLIPLAGTAVRNGQLDIEEIIYNVLAFIPFGIYISLLKPKWSFWKKIASIAAVSLLFETLQYVFAIGGSDITDLIGNTLGGIIGAGGYWLLRKVLRTKTNKVLNGLAAIGSLCMFAFVLLVMAGVIRFGN